MATMSRLATIFHIDMDSFFASVEQQARPRLRGKPIAVSGDPKSRTVVAAASREAKRWGVRSAMAIHEARALCPQIEFVLGDPDKYVEVSRRVFSIFERYTADVEVWSIDEAFLDVSGWVERYACPECQEHSFSVGAVLKNISPPPSGRGSDRGWGSGVGCGSVRLAERIKRDIAREVGEYITCSVGIATNKRLAKQASDFHKPDGIVLVYNDTHGPPAVHPSSPTMCHSEQDEESSAKTVCHSEQGEESRSGIVRDPSVVALPQDDTKTLALPQDDTKILALSQDNTVGSLRLIARSDLLASLSLSDFCGIGRRIEARLHTLGIRTVASLAAAPIDMLVEHFGVYGYDLHDMAHGHDCSSVEAEDADPKSMGHSVTLPHDIKTFTALQPIVAELAEKVAARLRRHGYRGGVVHVTVRYHDFSGKSEQRLLGQTTDDGLEISREAMRIVEGWVSGVGEGLQNISPHPLPTLGRDPGFYLLDSNVGTRRGSASESASGGERGWSVKNSRLSKPVRLVGISIERLVRHDPAQVSLFQKDRRWEQATRAMDEANERYGDWTVQRASLLNKERMLRKVAAAFKATRHLKDSFPPPPRAKRDPESSRDKRVSASESASGG
ncbi:MAG: DNA polymerase IV [Candidatus Uhrbacteria bacterium]